MAQIPSRPISPAVAVPTQAGGRLISGAITANPRNPIWRSRLRLASYKGVPFYVDQQGRSSGRRVVVFEYPKRDLPYAEDMGRHAIRYQITGYLIQAPGPGPNEVADTYNRMDRDYSIARDRLENVLTSPQPGLLVDPYNPRFFAPSNPTGNAQVAAMLAAQQAIPGVAQILLSGYGNQTPLFICERYSIIEQREKGGFCQVEMAFVEAGIPANSILATNTPAQVQSAAQQTLSNQAAATDTAQQAQQDPSTSTSQQPVQVPDTPVPPDQIPD